MTAKQLFKEIGWEITRIEYNSMTDKKTIIGGNEIKNFIEYRNAYNRYLYFDFDRKCVYLYFNENMDYCIMKDDLLQAINKQVEELGWGEKENEN